jgi:hypothetical protein
MGNPEEDEYQGNGVVWGCVFTIFFLMMIGSIILLVWFLKRHG